MQYHKPTQKEKILLGGEEEYSNTLPIVDEFENYIYGVCQELAEYDEETLKKQGITCQEDITTKKRNPWSYEYRDEGVLYQISCYQGGSLMGFNATQYGETPEMAEIRNLTNNMIMGSLRSMRFDSVIEAVTRNMHAREFSFEGNETLDKTDELYIDGVLPSPNKKVVFDFANGKYNTFYKEKDERPKCSYNTEDGDNYPGYMNADGTPFTGNNPESMTTYPSFDAAREEMEFKIEGFKNAWNSQLDKLKQHKSLS